MGDMGDVGHEKGAGQGIFFGKSALKPGAGKTTGIQEAPDPVNAEDDKVWRLVMRIQSTGPDLDDLRPDELAGVDPIGIADVVIPLHVRQALAVIAGNPAEGIAAADHIVIAIIRAVHGPAVGTVVAARSRGIPAGDVQHLPGVDIVVITGPRVGGIKRRQGYATAVRNLGQPVTRLDNVGGAAASMRGDVVRSKRKRGNQHCHYQSKLDHAFGEHFLFLLVDKTDKLHHLLYNFVGRNPINFYL